MAMPIGGWEGGTGMSTRRPIGRGRMLRWMLVGMPSGRGDADGDVKRDAYRMLIRLSIGKWEGCLLLCS